VLVDTIHKCDGQTGTRQAIAYAALFMRRVVNKRLRLLLMILPNANEVFRRLKFPAFVSYKKLLVSCNVVVSDLYSSNTFKV